MTFRFFSYSFEHSFCIYRLLWKWAHDKRYQILKNDWVTLFALGQKFTIMSCFRVTTGLDTRQTAGPHHGRSNSVGLGKAWEPVLQVSGKAFAAGGPHLGSISIKGLPLSNGKGKMSPTLISKTGLIAVPSPRSGFCNALAPGAPTSRIQTCTFY